MKGFNKWWHEVGSRPTIERHNLAYLAYKEGQKDALTTVEPPTKENTYHIWSEGYCATGESSTAYLHGVGHGATFKEACIAFFKKDNYFNANSLTHWGCHLFSSEADARKAFG